MKVLLVEPDRMLGETIQAALVGAGHVVLWRRTAQAALDSLDDQLPDLIILEPQLGIHNGIEFLYEIRSYGEWQHIPVIVHTINAKAPQANFASAFAELGVKKVLYKPRASTSQLLKAAANFQTVTI